MRIGKVRPIDNPPLPHAEPADNIFLGDRIHRFRNPRIDVDQPPFPAGRRDALKVRIQRRRRGYHIMQKFAEDGVHLQRIVVLEKTYDSLWRQAAELAEFVI